MAKLNDKIREHIVIGLACFQTPTEVAKSVGEEFSVTVTRQQVDDYNPTGRRASEVAKKWKALFEATRKAYLEDTSRIAIANQAVRLERLNRMAEKAEKMGNLPLVLQICEQASKEVGGMYTNKREFSGPNGGPIETRTLDASGMSDQALEEFMRARRDAESEAE